MYTGCSVRVLEKFDYFDFCYLIKTAAHRSFCLFLSTNGDTTEISGETLECVLSTAVSLFSDQPCCCAICHYYNSTIWRRSASKVIRVCCIFSVLIPSQVPVHYSSSNNAECTVCIITVRLVRAVCWEAALLHILHTPTFPICSHLMLVERREWEWERERETDRPLEWSAASPCFQPLWSGWRYPSGTYWWWSSHLQPGSGLQLLVSRSGQLGFPRWCDLFYEALPHMRFQLLANSDWACMCFN